MDQDYQKLYEGEKRVASLSRYFAGFAILISCLGLFGLAAFTAESRSKEICIRKILGASIPGIVQMLSLDLIKTIFYSLLIAVPVGIVVAQKWLNSFAFRIHLEPWFFILGGLLTVGIAAFTIGVQSLKAALTNPVKALRRE